MQWEARAKHYLPTSVSVLCAVRETAGGTSWKLSGTILQPSFCREKEFGVKSPGISTDALLHSPFLEPQPCCMSINKNPPRGIVSDLQLCSRKSILLLSQLLHNTSRQDVPLSAKHVIPLMPTCKTRNAVLKPLFSGLLNYWHVIFSFF